jgi:hypothetical protein
LTRKAVGVPVFFVRRFDPRSGSYAARVAPGVEWYRLACVLPDTPRT